MYEFLAPWGVLVPALSATLSYYMVQRFKRERQFSTFQAPESLALLLGSDMIFVDEF